ncbi:hypothetical protein H8356DRAFT_1436192 [Neocallimastix lanati (nom. inval.)]|nr:hypothetical protein H8356DRAFT_1436192 [Neocallimastix sp. JGI-2020a]
MRDFYVQKFISSGFIAKESFAGNNIILKKGVKYKTVDKRSYFRIRIYYVMDYFCPMNIQNILFKVNYFNAVHSNNNNIIKPKIWILGKELTEIRYSHKLRWYNITLQEKGFHHINDVLDTSNINEREEDNRIFSLLFEHIRFSLDFWPYRFGVDMDHTIIYDGVFFSDFLNHHRGRNNYIYLLTVIIYSSNRNAYYGEETPTSIDSETLYQLVLGTIQQEKNWKRLRNELIST